MKNSILVVHAVAEELAGVAHPPQIDFLVSGVGPIEAAAATAEALARTSYALVINAGIGGSLSPKIGIGEGVIVTSEYFFDIGREDGSAFTLPGSARVAAALTLPSALLDQMIEIDAHRGAAVTSAVVTTSSSRAQFMRERFPDAVVEAMEGFAVLRAAKRAGVPALELRGVSNIVGESGAWNFDAGRKAAISLLDEVVAAFL